MAETNSPDIRSIITDDEFGGFRITIPPTEGGRCAFGCGLAVVAFMMVLDFFYVVSDPSRNLYGGLEFLGACAGIVLVLGLVTAHSWIQEIVMIEGKTLILRKESPIFVRSQTFDLAGVRSLRPDRVNNPHGGGTFHAIAFEHRGRTHRCCVGLSADETVRLVKTIRSRFPIRDDWDDVEPLPVVT